MGVIGKFLRKLVGIGTSKPRESIIGTVIDKLVPDKAKAKEIMLEIQREAAKHEQDMEKDLLEDVQSARQLAIAEMVLTWKDPRTWVRPAWAFAGLVMWIITVANKTWVFNYWDYGIVTSIVAFYFGSRYLEKRKAMRAINGG